LKGIIIPGSSLSVPSAEEGQLEWYKNVKKLIQNIHQNYNKINLLGICFGAQIIAQALGGRVSKTREQFVQAAEILEIKDQFYKLPYVEKLNIDASKPLVIAQSHGEHIVELPIQAIKLASSKSAEIEIFAVGENILCFQGHPDLNEGWIRFVSHQSSKSHENDGNNLDHHPVSHKEFSMICYHFLKKTTEITEINIEMIVT